MMFMDQTLEEFIKNVNSKELPGGGSISALTALLGVGIGNMSFYLTEDKKSFKALDEKTQQEIRSHVDRLTEIILKALTLFFKHTSFLKKLTKKKHTERK